MIKNRHINIPVFIPHMGCPHTCIFCDQRRISGSRFQSPEKVERLLTESISTINPNDSVEIAFFGGSFTGIPMPEMLSYLETAKPYITDKRVRGIRLSTRPDNINPEIMRILLQYGVTTIELGVQSLDEEVLKLSRRGHTAEDVVNACSIIRDFGVRLGIQTMIGLPGDSFEKAYSTARDVINLKPDMIRIYPVLVLEGTELESLYRNGKYTPLPLFEAVEWCSSILPLYKEAGITVLRVGLHSSDTLEGSIVAGPYHPAFGELVESRIILRKMIAKLDNFQIHKEKITIRTRPDLLSKLVGQKRANIEALKSLYSLKDVTVIPDLAEGEFEIND